MSDNSDKSDVDQSLTLAWLYLTFQLENRHSILMAFFIVVLLLDAI